jgi:hypothetical protein
MKLEPWYHCFNILFVVINDHYFSCFRHPLFPLMTQLFERCEKATYGGPWNSNLSEGFDEDILAFVRQQEQNGLPFFIDNPDVDGLVSRSAGYSRDVCLQCLLAYSVYLA